MTETPTHTEERCMKCGANEQLFVSLDCEHNFCLVCMSYVMIKCKAQKQNDSTVPCPLCQQTTHLDAESVEAIQETIENILVPNLTNYNPIEEVSGENLEELDRVQAVSVKKSSGETKVQSVMGTGIMFDKESIKVSKRFSEDPSYDYLAPSAGKYYFSKCGTPASKSKDTLSFKECCSVHPLQQLTSICLSCDNQLLCLKCLVLLKHKTHYIRSVSKGVDCLTEQVNFKKLEINDKLEHLSIGERRVKDKLDLLKERLLRSQENIAESFEQLVKQIQRKENQLQQECLEQYRVVESTLDKELQAVNNEICYLQNFRERIQEVFLTEKPYEFIQSYNSMLPLMGTNIEEYKPVNTIDFYSNEYLQISQQSLVNLFEEINRVAFDVSTCTTTTNRSLNSTHNKLAAFISCHTSREKKKSLKTEQDIRPLRKKEMVFQTSRGCESRRDITQYVSTMQRQMTSKGPYEDRSMDNHSKMSSFSKTSLSKLLSKNAMAELQRKSKALSKEKTEKKMGSSVMAKEYKDFNKSQKVISMKRKRL